MFQPSLFQPCRHCGGDRNAPDHDLHCDGRQGAVEDRTFNDVPAAGPVEEGDDDDPREGTIAERAERFHKRNPSVYDYAVSLCRYLRRRRVLHYGIGAVWEVMRFKYLETHGDIYKLNNNFRAWYSRRIMEQEPDLVGFFTIRDCPNDPEYRLREVRE
jgi:hypothetical protein